MTIIAKYASTCPNCSQPIKPGQQVEWERGQKARHTNCGATAAVSSPSAERTITVERVGRRSYLRGDTLSVRGMLRSGGCHWDADAKAWWIGSHDEALALAERAKTAPAQVAPRPPRRCIACGHEERRDHRGYPVGDRILRSGECQSCYEERKMGY